MRINNRSKIIIAMFIWSTIGIFIKNIELPSIEIALFRAVIGMTFLDLLGIIKKEKLDRAVLKRNLIYLIGSGLALGINWILLFESYKNTTIANATLSYYMAPIIIVILCFVIFKEKLNSRRLVCIIGAVIGLIVVLQNDGVRNINNYDHIKGILYGLSAALFYALVVVFNKMIQDLSGFHITIIQLLISIIVILPVAFITTGLRLQSIGISQILLLVFIGIFHTGIAYLLYFSSLKNMEGQSIAILSYIDPIFALVFSWIILKETMNMVQILGGIAILSSAYLSEKG